jgi:manganese-dependent inorganic pyrophosphatase
MMKKATILMMLFVLGMFSSCSVEDNYVDTPTPPGDELREKLRALDWGSDTCYVYGHKTPDVDAVTSALAYARLMQSLGYNCKAKVSSGMNRETEYIATFFGFELPELKTSVAPQTRLILTDHADYMQCVDGAREAVILQVIDHHEDGEIAKSGIPIVRREMVGSTNTIIFGMYQELGVAIDDETARIMLAGIVSDTKNLKKASTCAADTAVWEALTEQLGISPDSMAVVYKQMSKASDDVSGMTDKEIFLSDYKGYEYNGYLFGMGSLESKKEKIDDYLDRLLAVMPEVLAEKGLDMVFAKIDYKVPNPDTSDPDNKYVNAGTYLIYYGTGAREVAEAILGASLREGVTYSETKISRKEFIPLIQEQLGS